MPKWLLSKRFYYGLFTLAFIIILLSFIYYSLIGSAFATAFIPEVMGWLVTLLIFTIFFDLREELEWKEIEDRVKKRIGRKIRELFAELSMLCEVKREHHDSKESRAEFVGWQLKTLASEKIKLGAGTKKELNDRTFRRNCALSLESIETYLGNVEDRYSRFLGSEIRASLMDIQDYLYELSIEFRLRYTEKEEEFISYWIGKIMKEILRLKTKGIWFDW